jgi:hypothetical protein
LKKCPVSDREFPMAELLNSRSHYPGVEPSATSGEKIRSVGSGQVPLVMSHRAILPCREQLLIIILHKAVIDV